MDNIVIQCENINLDFNTQVALRDISFHIEEGDFVALIGPNGGGKTTLLKVILGVLKPDSGKIEVFKKEPKEALEFVGYVPQNTNINPSFPIKSIDVVLSGIKKSSLSPFYSKKEKQKAYDMLERVGVERLGAKKISELSGGQRQRVMIARALISSPKLLLLDEPTASIDSKGQLKIYDLLKELNKKMTIISISHEIMLSFDYATKILHLNRTLTEHEVPNVKNIRDELEGKTHICEVEILEALSRDRELKC
jgi:zinc transport system ATP-binding protein